MLPGGKTDLLASCLFEACPFAEWRTFTIRPNHPFTMHELAFAENLAGASQGDATAPQRGHA